MAKGQYVEHKIFEGENGYDQARLYALEQFEEHFSRSIEVSGVHNKLRVFATNSVSPSDEVGILGWAFKELDPTLPILIKVFYHPT